MTSVYGGEAAELLRVWSADLPAMLHEFVDGTYRTVPADTPLGEIVARLTPDQRTELIAREAAYLARVFSPEISEAEHRSAAHDAGRTHALVGVGPQTLTETYVQLQQRFHAIERTYPPEVAAPLSRILDLRILLDLSAQTATLGEISRSITIAITQIDAVLANTAGLDDLIRGTFAVLDGLDGIAAGLFLRADDRGELQVEASLGSGDRYHHAMEEGRIPKINLDPELSAGQGPGGRAWRSGEIVTANAWMNVGEGLPWRSAAEELGYRAAAAIPLVDSSGRTAALIMLYSGYPGFFATNRIGKFLGYLQQVLGRESALRIHAPVIPLRIRAAYRSLLREQRVAVLYQPLVDLRDGSVPKIEALARLLDENDELIPADAFIPALGEEDLFELTRSVLARACRDCRALERDGVVTSVSVNIPAHALGESRYRDTIFRALREHELEPRRLVLEVLETPLDTIDTAARTSIAAELRAAGIAVVQDDLGSAHSSLVRLDSYPFDGVKIDQTLVRGAREKPLRSLEFVLYLTRLVHALGALVTVEGLEDAALVEAAAILGADRGQGYGIAQPMPFSALPAWFGSYRYEVDVQSPRSALGALAGFLLWDLQLGELARWPNLAEQFVGADSLLERYAGRHARDDATLGRLIERNRIAALHGAHDARYRSTRSDIVRALRAHVHDGR